MKDFSPMMSTTAFCCCNRRLMEFTVGLVIVLLFFYHTSFVDFSNEHAGDNVVLFLNVSPALASRFSALEPVCSILLLTVSSGYQYSQVSYAQEIGLLPEKGPSKADLFQVYRKALVTQKEIHFAYISSEKIKSLLRTWLPCSRPGTGRKAELAGAQTDPAPPFSHGLCVFSSFEQETSIARVVRSPLKGQRLRNMSSLL